MRVEIVLLGGFGLRIDDRPIDGPELRRRDPVHLIELLESGSKQDVESYARWHKLRTVEAYRAIHS